MVRPLPTCALLIALVWPAGCGPSVPGETEARSWYEADEETIRAFDEQTRRYIGVEALLAAAPTDDPNYLELGARRERARAAFRESALPGLANETGALGVQLRLLDGPSDTGVLGGAGTPAPARKDGSVAPEDGVEIEGRRLGWGVYTIDAEDAGTRDVRGYEVYWEAGIEGRMVGFRMYMPGR